MTTTRIQRALRRMPHLIGAGMIMGSVGSAPALAQNAEIVVTARKVEENLQDVPVSVTAFTGEAFEEAGLTEFADIAVLTPNFDARPLGPIGSIFSSLIIRGQTSGSQVLNADEAVGINVNGAPITHGTSLFSNLFDIERIEVLKGPQGTLYGKNTTGGVINVVTKGPDLDEFGGYSKFTYGSFDRTDAELVVNLPLIEDTLGIRLGGALTHRDGFGEGVDTGRELADDNELLLRGSLLYEPSERFSVRINADYHEVDESTAIFRSLRGAELDLGFIVLPIAVETTDPDFYKGNDFRDDAPFVRSDELNINGTIKVGVGSALLTSITSYREQDALTLVQSAPGTEIVMGQNSSIFAQEFQLTGNAVGGRLNWQVGTFYSKEQGEDIDNIAQIQVNAAANEGWSLFTQNSFDLTERLKLTLGLRYTNENRKVEVVEDSNNPLVLSNEADFDAFSWLASLDYKPTPETLVYASVSRGFRSGAIDQDNLATIVDPEFVLNYEVGLKADLFDNKVRFNTSVFYSDYTDIQRIAFDTENVSNAGVATTILRNAAEATIWGFEAELQISPIEGLSFGGALGHTNAGFDEFFDLDGAGNIIDRSDEPIGGVPWQYSVNGRYETRLSDTANLGIQANYSWVDELPITTPAVVAALDPGEGVIAPYGLLNGQIDLDISDLGGNFGGLNVAIFGTNLFDKEYFTSGIALDIFGGISNKLVGEPRQFGIRMTKDF